MQSTVCIAAFLWHSEVVEWETKFQGVTKDEQWYGRNPAGMQETWAEAALLRELHRTNQWHRIDAAWQVSLMPEGALVRRRSDGYVCFAIRTFKTAFVGWRPEQVELRL